MKSIIILTGQTATGKTSHALKLAQKYHGELINCDSRQVYKKLDIITGKDIPKNSKFKVQSSKLQFKIKNGENFDLGFYPIPTDLTDSTDSTKLWLYDIVEPNQYFSSYDWVQCAIPIIKDILKRGKTPIIIGGTYLYLYHLLYEVKTQTIPPNWELRNKLNSRSISYLQNRLKKISISQFNRLNNSDRNNPQRLIRKIEIAKASSPNLPNSPISSSKFPYNPLFSSNQFDLNKKLNLGDLDIKFVGFKFIEKEILRQKIVARVEERLKNKAVDEVKNLLDLGYKPTDPGLKTIGYQQIIRYINKEFTLEEAKIDWINKEIQYAKRQLTFMKKDKNIIWKNVK